MWEAPGLLKELHAETFDLLAYGQALEEHAARIFRDYDEGRFTADDTVARMRALLWGQQGHITGQLRQLLGLRLFDN